MTRLRPVVVPVAALALATAAPSATAQPRRPVTQWAEHPLGPCPGRRARGSSTPRAALVQPATSLPLAVLIPWARRPSRTAGTRRRHPPPPPARPAVHSSRPRAGHHADRPCAAGGQHGLPPRSPAHHVRAVCEHVFVYVELHAHSAFSFLDGASLPDELAAAAAELGYEAMALTDHNGVSGSMEFAQAAAPLGLRAIHGAEVDLDDGRHLTLLVEDERGWRNLCHRSRARTRTRAGRSTRRRGPCGATVGHGAAVAGRHAHAAGRRAAELSLAALDEHAAGLVCLSGCARQRRARRADAAAAAGRLRARPPAGRAAAAVPAPRPRAQPRAGRAGGAAGRADGGDRQRPRARARARAAAGRVRGAAPSHDAGRVGAACGAATSRTCSPRRRRWRRASPSTRRRWRRRGELAARLRFDLQRRPRLPLPGGGGRAGARASSPSCAGRCSRSATRRARRTRRRRTRGSRRSCG